ncbi:WH1 domain-containing protein [Apiospora sp. TS-2023a]
MPSILSDEDKETVKRTVPKQTNKIQAVAVARLYVAFPNRSKWTYTGLQGAVVLANDLVGNTYWLKLVDISPSARGVIWDQEIFDIWSYNQDRTFFHTFELEECLAGLSFVDEKEAKQFKKKMDEREKNASKATRNTPFGGSNQAQPAKHKTAVFRLRLRLPPTHSKTSSTNANGVHKPSSEFATLEAYDPLWRENFGNFLTEQGLTDEFIKENQEFIVGFLQEQGGEVPKSAAAPPPPPPPVNGHSTPGHGRAPPPPPPPPSSSRPAAPDSSAGTRRGVPPPPPAPRRSVKTDTVTREPTPPQEATPPRPRFNAPPPLPDAGKYAHLETPQRSASAAPAPGPPPPRDHPRHPWTAMKTRRPGAATASERHTLGALTSTITAAKGTGLERTSVATLIIETRSSTPTKECARSSPCSSFGSTSAATSTEIKCAITTSFAELKRTTTSSPTELERTAAATSTELRCTAATTGTELRCTTSATTAAADASCVWRSPTTPSSTSTSARGCRRRTSASTSAASTARQPRQRIRIWQAKFVTEAVQLSEEVVTQAHTVVAFRLRVLPQEEAAWPTHLLQRCRNGKQKVGDSDDEGDDDEW